MKALEAAGLGKPGGARAPRLLGLGKEMRGALEDLGYTLVRNEEPDTRTADLPACPEAADTLVVPAPVHGNGHTE